MAKKIESRGKQCWGGACFFIVSPGLIFPPVHESLNKRALHVSGSMTVGPRVISLTILNPDESNRLIFNFE